MSCVSVSGIHKLRQESAIHDAVARQGVPHLPLKVAFIHSLRESTMAHRHKPACRWHQERGAVSTAAAWPRRFRKTDVSARRSCDQRQQQKGRARGGRRGVPHRGSFIRHPHMFVGHLNTAVVARAAVAIAVADRPAQHNTTATLNSRRVHLPATVVPVPSAWEAARRVYPTASATPRNLTPLTPSHPSIIL